MGVYLAMPLDVNMVQYWEIHVDACSGENLVVGWDSCLVLLMAARLE